MKRHLLIATVIMVFMATGCRKLLTPADEKMVGTWTLDDVARSQLVGWDEIPFDLQDGIFRFEGNGEVTYTKNGDTLQGRWNIRRVIGGYYDQNEERQTGSHLVMNLSLTEPGLGRFYQLDFDDVNFRTYDRIVALEYNYLRRYRYRFRRL